MSWYVIILTVGLPTKFDGLYSLSTKVLPASEWSILEAQNRLPAIPSNSVLLTLEASTFTLSKRVKEMTMEILSRLYGDLDHSHSAALGALNSYISGHGEWGVLR